MTLVADIAFFPHLVSPSGTVAKRLAQFGWLRLLNRMLFTPHGSDDRAFDAPA
jgi:hypothetical protein